MYQETQATERVDFAETTSVGNGAGVNGAKPYEVLHKVHKTIIDLADLGVLTLLDATVGLGTKIYTFPVGRILIHGARLKNLAVTTTSVLASTLNASKTLSAGVGSTTQANGTVATTEQDIVNVFGPTSSATINVAGTAASGNGPSAPFSLDGTGTAIAAFFNIGVPTATDIDGDATVTVTGMAEITWSNIGA